MPISASCPFNEIARLPAASALRRELFFPGALGVNQPGGDYRACARERLTPGYREWWLEKRLVGSWCLAGNVSEVTLDRGCGAGTSIEARL